MSDTLPVLGAEEPEFVQVKRLIPTRDVILQIPPNGIISEGVIKFLFYDEIGPVFIIRYAAGDGPTYAFRREGQFEYATQN